MVSWFPAFQLGRVKVRRVCSGREYSPDREPQGAGLLRSLRFLSHFVSKSFDNRRKGNGGSTAHSLVVGHPASGVARASLTLTCVAPRLPRPVLSHSAACQVATPVTALAGDVSHWPASLCPADHSLLRAPLLRITGDTAGSTPVYVALLSPMVLSWTGVPGPETAIPGAPRGLVAFPRGDTRKGCPRCDVRQSDVRCQ